MITELNQIVSFIETQCNTITQFDKVQYTGNDDTVPNVKTFGVHIYMNEEDVVEVSRQHIGPIQTEVWSVNVDIIIKKHHSNPRTAVSDSLGTSYWIKTIQALFLNKKNGGLFKTSRWTPDKPEDINDGIKIPGIFTCEIVNRYT